MVWVGPGFKRRHCHNELTRGEHVAHQRIAWSLSRGAGGTPRKRLWTMRVAVGWPLIISFIVWGIDSLMALVVLVIACRERLWE